MPDTVTGGWGMLRRSVALAFVLCLVGAACSIPVRLFLIFTVGLGHPAAGMKYRRMLPYLMPWDWLWAPSPFLMVHSIGPEWALVLTAVLVYPPISQLILMRSIEHHRNRGTQ